MAGTRKPARYALGVTGLFVNRVGRSTGSPLRHTRTVFLLNRRNHLFTRGCVRDAPRDIAKESEHEHAAGFVLVYSARAEIEQILFRHPRDGRAVGCFHIVGFDLQRRDRVHLGRGIEHQHLLREIRIRSPALQTDID